MRYLQILTVDPDLVSAGPREQRSDLDTLLSWLDELEAAGASFLQGSRLRPPGDATTVKIRDGQVIITDGPYAETKEQIGGYGVLEVRPFWPFEEYQPNPLADAHVGPSAA